MLHAVPGLLLLLLSPGPSLAASPSPLFESPAVLDLELRADLSPILQFRSPTRGSLTEPGGHETSVEISPRGRDRLIRCDFPPLKLKFQGAVAAGSVFEGQKKLKLVTHCDAYSTGSPAENAANDESVLREHLVYQVAELLGMGGFRTRLARVSYRDTSGDLPFQTRTAFWIESPRELAARRGLTNLSDSEEDGTAGVPAAWIDAESLATLEAFELLIGNADYSTRRGDVLFLSNVSGLRDFQGRIFLVPFDFDRSAWVTTDFGRYNGRYFGTDRVAGIAQLLRERYSDPRHASAFESFRRNRRPLEALYRSGTLSRRLSPDYRRAVLAQIDVFFRALRAAGRPAR